MIQQLSNKFQKGTATFMIGVCLNAMIIPIQTLASYRNNYTPYYRLNANYSSSKSQNVTHNNLSTKTKKPIPKNAGKVKKIESEVVKNEKKNQPEIGGPSQPEMTSFKSVGTDNMVNLFTGDFSYNIPLLDVGGYPVNIYYDGGVSMEQDASWVGLGWNINPGNVNRNVRGVPDDFDGTDVMTQIQDMKKNVTVGATLGVDLELVGIKNNPFSGSVGASLGVSVNNYLGPALDIGIKGATHVSVGAKAQSEKAAPTIGGSLSINASSRSGVTFTPAVSLSASTKLKDNAGSIGFSLKGSTSYNSRSGIKAIQISEQMSFNKTAKNAGEIVGNKIANSMGNFSQSITFNKPSYVPTMRMPTTSEAWSGHFQAGGGIFGVAVDGDIEVYKQKTEVAPEDRVQTKPMVGYLYMQNAANNANAVMDFTRVNDNEVTPNTPIISAPQYAYDVYSIQGEGTGGSIRAYRNDEGYVRDNFTMSKDRNLSFGGDIDVPGHYGGNFSKIKTPSTVGEWAAGNKLRSITGFEAKTPNTTFENVYFRNPGENSVLNPNQYNRIGGLNLVRYKLGGNAVSPTIEPKLELFSKSLSLMSTIDIPVTPKMLERKKRSQVISFLTAAEASQIGLDKNIKTYDGINVLENQAGQTVLKFTPISRTLGYRKANHISQINVTEASGQRYVYGIPVYNTAQKDFTFTVNNGESITNPDKVDIGSSEPTTLNGGVKDGYIQQTVTPPYAHSFLLSGLLSPDYVDVTNDGITEDDLGNAVKFNYSMMPGISKWRTPLSATPMANFVAGKRTEDKDDKGMISYGERESWYTHSIESKTMIALFKLENRNDAKGTASDVDGGINGGDNTAKRLKQIDLYSKADLRKNGIAGAKPIKSVFFEYNYNLCKNAPNNTTTGEGKLTLQRIYFTFNGKNRASKNQYVFDYGQSATENPNYAFNASDRWGTYKPGAVNPQGMKNSDYPYSKQDKAIADQNAGAWMLKKILLPSGGQMEVTYESDDYAFVQNKRAATMMEVAGFGNASTGAYSERLYDVNGGGVTDNYYAFFKVPDACVSSTDVYKKYLEGIQQLSFKLAVNMPKGMEFVHSYATIDGNNYGVYGGDNTGKTIWVKLNPVDNKSPLSLTAVEFLREQLPGQAYGGYDVSESIGMAQIGDMLMGLLDGIKHAFGDPVAVLREDGKAQTVDVTRSFVRLNDPDGVKYGGGYRVKAIRLKDNWKEMNGGQLYTSTYGQDYDYSTKEIFNGTERIISSGVASYEPSLGGDENPFQTMIQVENKVPLGPASYGAVEMPVLDAFFPAASVGYSKVTVKSFTKGPTDPSKKTRSGIGKQVSEYFTAKDYPVYYNNTSLDPSSDLQANLSSFGAFFFKYAFDSRALSQGFLVETNDMHGKMKSQASYPEGDDKAAINYTQNFYRNTGSKGLVEKFDFVYASQGGAISQGNMGIDVELMTDTREFSVKSTSFELQAQVDLFPVFGVFPWLPFAWPTFGATENTYRAVTATKVISYHSILDSVIVIDKGSQVSTKNLVYDAETGDVIVNRTNNEYKQPIYNTNYPAWWAYSGMGLAYKNIDAQFTGINFRSGKMLNPLAQSNIFESGDELYVTGGGGTPDACVAESPTATRLWAFDKNKDNSSLTNPTPDLYFMDADGKLYTKSNVSFRIVRSGKRNNLSASIGSAISMKEPFANGKLVIDNNSKVINATAVEFKEKWQNDNDVFKRYTDVVNPANCSVTANETCDGYLEKSINPYVKGLLGTFRTNQSKVFYNNRKESNTTVNTNLPINGYLDNFKLYWNFDNATNNVVPDVASTKWVWNSQITKINSKGLELETKDALGIYTAAQYGFNKTTPVAIANNSRYNEMFAEGFEDNDYNERLNVASNNNCAKRHINFSGIGNASVETATGNLKAHTGKNMLKVNGQTQANLQLETIDNVINEFGLEINEDAEKSLNTIGGTISDVLYGNTSPSGVPLFNPTPYWNFIPSGGGTLLGVNTGSIFSPSITEPSFNYLNYSFKTTQYIEILQPITFTGYTSIFINSYGALHLCGGTREPRMSILVQNVNTGIITNFLNNPVGTSYDDNGGVMREGYGAQAFALYLCPGIYKIECICYNIITNAYFCPGTQLGQIYDEHFGIYINPNGIQTVPISFKNLSSENSCIFNKPISALEPMLNSIYSPRSGKRMLFSAWVKEICTTGTCYDKIDYTNSNIEIWSGGTNIGATTATNINGVKRVGNIIEGWQKIEGEFTIPSGATNAEIRFINSNSAPMYLDDIRMQPYNANVKSYVYDPINLRLVAELDANNYASFYEYDEEGTLIRTKVETKEGIKTIKETRSAKQKGIATVQ